MPAPDGIVPVNSIARFLRIQLVSATVITSLVTVVAVAADLNVLAIYARASSTINARLRSSCKLA